jgi:hypothetical protein
MSEGIAFLIADERMKSKPGQRRKKQSGKRAVPLKKGWREEGTRGRVDYCFNP